MTAELFSEGRCEFSVTKPTELIFNVLLDDDRWQEGGLRTGGLRLVFAISAGSSYP